MEEARRSAGADQLAEARRRGLGILRLGKVENFRRVNVHPIVMQIRARNGKFCSIAL